MNDSINLMTEDLETSAMDVYHAIYYLRLFKKLVSVVILDDHYMFTLTFFTFYSGIWLVWHPLVWPLSALISELLAYPE